VWVTVALQWAVVLLVAVIAWAVFGQPSARSAFAGGAAVALPNMLFALGLILRMRLRGGVSAAVLLGGELGKLALTIALLAVAVKFAQPQPVWLAVLAGVVLAVKAQWLALWVTREM